MLVLIMDLQGAAARRTCVWLRCCEGSETPPGPTRMAAAEVSAMGPCMEWNREGRRGVNGRVGHITSAA